MIRRSGRGTAAASAKANLKYDTMESTESSSVKRSPDSRQSTKPSSKKLKTANLSSESIIPESLSGVVDPEAGIDGTVTLLDNMPCDVMLVQLDPAKTMDRFYVLQLIETPTNSFTVHSRWGRTGTKGQSLKQDFAASHLAEECFMKKFTQKTGLTWEHRAGSPKVGKYRFIAQDYENKKVGFSGALWRYWLDDGVDGKKEGWYDFDPVDMIQTERLFSEHTKNSGLVRRWRKFGSQNYELDLANMTQTDVKDKTRSVRRIQRCPKDSNKEENSEITSGTKAKTDAKIKPPPTTPARSSTVPNVVTPNVGPDVSVSRPPVDPEVFLHNINAADYEVVAFTSNPNRYYSVMLNQCNITKGNNNNKYYRIQMILEVASSKFYVWQKWGRVGEPGRSSSSALKGPYASEEQALREYSGKFKAKTGNAWDTENFVSKSGKYTLIEIADGMNTEEPSLESVEYKPSKLDPKTKDLVEVLFSKEMRNEALANFKLDLKRLPLGVPSQQQIQHGISILQKIENKLGGNLVAGSFDELSSDFYTAIPHSFGRSRPPIIDTSSSLQMRYDMCNILLDMYSTNETIRQLEDRTESNSVIVRENPVDRHYESLNTDLTLVDDNSLEYKTIVNYFQNTRGLHSRSHMLDIWQVNRRTEGERFKQFDKLDNRRLLWHGTNIAVVAPILTNGLRIMPHAGGRVGAGIYLAALQEKSQQYTSGYNSKYACMFLCEAAMGKMHKINSDGHHASSLKKAPDGFDSVHAVGKWTPQEWGEIQVDGNKVSVPVSKAEQKTSETSFSHDEFLCYEEAQVRLRYIVTIRL